MRLTNLKFVQMKATRRKNSTGLEAKAILVTAPTVKIEGIYLTLKQRPTVAIANPESLSER